jgi:hypothetical protein
MSNEGDDKDIAILEGITANSKYDDYMDSDGINLAFGIFTFLYFLALMVFYAGPVVENSFQFDSVLAGMVYWSLFKTLIPFFSIVFTVFNITNFPLTFVMLTVIGSGFLNSIGFAVDFLYAGLRANTANLPNNIANDPLRCCVYYNVPNSGCDPADGPCAPNYPQTKLDLILNDSFVFYCTMIGILGLFEIIMLILVLILRRTRIDKEKEFFAKAVQEEMTNDKTKVTLEATDVQRKIDTLYGKMNGIIRRTLREFGKLKSQSGFSANMDESLNTKKNR